MPADQPNDYYKILELSSTCTADEIKAAYRRLALSRHPDRNPENANATAEFQVLGQAYETLSDPLRRQIYNLEQANTQRSRQNNTHTTPPEPQRRSAGYPFQSQSYRNQYHQSQYYHSQGSQSQNFYPSQSQSYHSQESRSQNGYQSQGYNRPFEGDPFQRYQFYRQAYQSQPFPNDPIRNEHFTAYTEIAASSCEPWRRRDFVAWEAAKLRMFAMRFARFGVMSPTSEEFQHMEGAERARLRQIWTQNTVGSEPR